MAKASLYPANPMHPPEGLTEPSSQYKTQTFLVLLANIDDTGAARISQAELCDLLGTGPGRVWLQSMTMQHLAHAIQEYLPRRREAGAAGIAIDILSGG